MTQKRMEEIIKSMEGSPDMPYMCLHEMEALEAAELLRRKYKGTRLVMLRGIRYLTITDAALRAITEQLERERREYAKILERYDRELAGVAGLAGGTGRRRYWSEACAAPEPADRQEWTGRDSPAHC